MKTKATIFITLCAFQFIFCADCFTDTEPGSAQDCQTRGNTNDYYCCYVEYRTDKDATYRKLCVNVRKKDIDKGLFEGTMQTIESGNYTASNWNEHQLSHFQNFASINEFECNSNYLTVSLLLFVLYFIL